MPLMSLSTYAKHRGVSPAAVTKAVKAGRIHKGLITNEASKKKLIDSEIADREWEKNTDPSQRREKKEALKEYEENSGNSDDKGKADPQEREARSSGSPKIPSLRESKAIKEAYLARMARIDYEVKAQTYIPTDEVRHHNFTIARKIRDILLNIPNKCSHKLASISDGASVHRVLTDEIHEALEILSSQRLRETGLL